MSKMCGGFFVCFFGGLLMLAELFGAFPVAVTVSFLYEGEITVKDDVILDVCVCVCVWMQE